MSSAPVPPAPEKKGGIPAWMLIPILLVLGVVIFLLVPSNQKTADKDKDGAKPQEKAP